MAVIRSVNEIILSLLDFYKLSQPDLDTKPGTVARDLFIDGPASQLSILYDELSENSNKQSLRLVIGSDLDKLAKNFGVVRRQSSAASGVALLTFNSLNAPINIARGNTVISTNGFTYSILNGISVLPAAANLYRSIASKFKDQLEFVGITDEFAVEVTVTATSPGSSGNIGSYSLNRTSIPGISNVTNIRAFVGGTDQEKDVSFRTRILSSFSGSSVGTALGYLNSALSVDGVSDAFVVEPGDVLMTRDGTDVKVATDGTRTIVSEGSGGKVDVVILGSSLIENVDSFIYQDKSNNNDPTNSKNDIVLGQISGDENKTIKRKRIDNIANGVLPNQPVNSVLSVTGSLSGSNFAIKSTDSYGRVTGNYELVKDTGVYGGSPWGFDKFHWISDRISLFQEDRVKGQFGGQDNVTFTDVLDISNVQQIISISNENSTVTSDRSIIQLLHYPATNVTRVFNVNTGERYIVTSQNFDQTGTYNTTGRIKISGNTLPSPSDILQVDYNWIVNYDRYSDFDGLKNSYNARVVTDSVDWGLSSLIKNEKINFNKTTGSNFFIGTSSHPVNTVISAIKYSEFTGIVKKVTSGVYINRLSVTLENLAIPTETVDSVKLKNSNNEVYNTAQADSNFSNLVGIFGITTVYNTVIILPSDTTAIEDGYVTVHLNSSNVFSDGLLSGSSNGTQITIPASLVNSAASNITLKVNYVADVNDLYNSATTSLPASRLGNGYVYNNLGFNNFTPVNTSIRENQIVQLNISLQISVTLNLSSTNYLLTSDQITIIRLSDKAILWDINHQGTVSINANNNYDLVFSGFNTPAIGDSVLVIYYAKDIRRFQPFSFLNSTISSKIRQLGNDSVLDKFTVPLNSFVTQAAGVNFTITETNNDITLFNLTNGVLTANSNGTASLYSATSFTAIPDILLKKVTIKNATNINNDGVYDIVSYNKITNTLTIKNLLNNVHNNQISVIRILDGKEIWSSSGTVDTVNNRLLIPKNSFTNVNDHVYVTFFNHENLRKSPTILNATIADQVANNGVVSIDGTTIYKADSVIFTATSSGFKLNLSEAVRKSLKLNSTSSIPSNIKLARIMKLEKVTTVGSNNDEVVQVLATYDLKNSIIQNNIFYSDEFISNPLFGNFDFTIPSSTNNTVNSPKIGDKLRVSFYYTVDGEIENLQYTRNGSLYTNKKFAFINKIYVSSGFRSSQSTTLTLSNFNQPALGSRYKVFYDYLAPKKNERISINYNFNKLISDVTFNLESTRPINADVLARAGNQVLLDLTINVVIADDFLTTSTTVLQNLKNQLITSMTTTELGGIVDTVDLINDAQSVQGISRARILYFNKTGVMGQVSSITAQNDEYFGANKIIINTETR